MPQGAFTIYERAHMAQQRLTEQGGKNALPEVLTPKEAQIILGREWYTMLRRLDLLPGARPVGGGAWRCDRTAFCAWIETLAATPDESELAHGS
jgi:hypothetical protein